MSFCIVVSRFNEDVNWTKQFQNVIIYNKGDKLPDDFNQVLLKNVGREPHTYYTHIYENYANLADYTIFLQGNPFEHSPNILESLNRYVNSKNLNIGFKFLSERILDSNLSGCPHHANLPLADTYEKIFNERKDEMKLVFGAGAQFIVSKELILNNSKSFYSKIVELLEYDIQPIEAYIIERLHEIIFIQPIEAFTQDNIFEKYLNF